MGMEAFVPWHAGASVSAPFRDPLWRCRSVTNILREGHESKGLARCPQGLGPLALCLAARHVGRQRGRRVCSRSVAEVAEVAVAEDMSSLGEVKGAVKVHRGRERLIEDATPNIYTRAVQEVLGAPLAGDLVEVINDDEKVLAWGFFHPGSMYTVRVIAREHEWRDEPSDPDVSALLLRRLQRAVSTRHSLGLPRQGEDDAFRLVNGEGDGIPGLVVDVYGHIAVVESWALWVEKHREALEVQLRAALAEVPDLKILWRRQLADLHRDGVEIMEDGSEESNTEEIQVIESGLRYFVSPGSGQKTGLFMDQRENRRMIRELVSRQRTPPRVLDLCSYHGAFSISALAGGAAEVTAVDNSEPALEVARRNAELNGFSDRLRCERTDITTFMYGALQRNEEYDIVILDPPKLARSRDPLSLAKASRKYQGLNEEAMKVVAKGGLLLTCTCSSAMTNDGDRFLFTVGSAARSVQRDVTLLSQTGAAPDHPNSTACPQVGYLTALLFRVA